MPANLKVLLFGFILTCTLSGCGAIEKVNTPESWGASGGSYGAKQWIETHGKGVWPSTDSASIYCVTIAEEGQKKFSWTFEQALKSADACVKAFVDGLK